MYQGLLLYSFYIELVIHKRNRIQMAINKTIVWLIGLQRYNKQVYMHIPNAYTYIYIHINTRALVFQGRIRFILPIVWNMKKNGLSSIVGMNMII